MEITRFIEIGLLKKLTNFENCVIEREVTKWNKIHHIKTV